MATALPFAVFATTGVRLAGAVAAAFAAGWIVLTRRVRFEFDSEGLRVTNHIMSRTWTWDAIERVQTSHRIMGFDRGSLFGCLEVHGREGRRMASVATMKCSPEVIESLIAQLDVLAKAHDVPILFDRTRFPKV
jgi:hypothetical protein